MPTEMNPPSRIDSDATLAYRVALFLAYQRDVDLQQITVHADQGRVILEGAVSLLRERQRALMAARNVAGVIKIIDRITVRSSRGERENVTLPLCLLHNESTAESLPLSKL